MRKTFFSLLEREMSENDKIFFQTGDLGFSFIEPIQQKFPTRYYNCQAAEFSMAGIACGLALEGKIPITYTITPFYLRAFELLRTYVNKEKIPIKMVAIGQLNEYSTEGFSHWGHDFRELISPFKEIIQFWPQSKEEVVDNFKSFIYNDKPSVLVLKK